MKRTFGIEMEFMDAYFRDMEDELNNLVLSYPFVCSDYNQQPESNGNSWHLKYDISVSDNFNGKKTGGEVASPVFTANQKTFKEIHKVINAMNNCISQPTFMKETGLHIHVDIDDIDRFKFLIIWLGLEKDIYRLFPSRRHNQYTKFLYRKTKKNLNLPIEQKLELAFKNNTTKDLFGYKKNALLFYKRNNKNFLEVRIGQMYENPNITTGWIKLVLQMIDATFTRDTLELMDKNPFTSFQILNKNSCKELQLNEAERLVCF